MASKSARKRRKRRPPPRPEPASEAEHSSDKVASAAPVKRRARGEAESPPAPWGNFPLIELAVLTGIIMLLLGFFAVEGTRGAILIAAGLTLGSIGGLELSIREHFAGYQSHTLVLAGVPALVVLGLLFYLGPDGLPTLARGGIGIAVFAAGAILLSRAFSRRSGGVRYKTQPFRKR